MNYEWWFLGISDVTDIRNAWFDKNNPDRGLI